MDTVKTFSRRLARIFAVKTELKNLLPPMDADLRREIFFLICVNLRVAAGNQRSKLLNLLPSSVSIGCYRRS
jgi:hypothetical protein